MNQPTSFNGLIATRSNEAPRASAPVLCEHCAIRSVSLCGALTTDEIVALNEISARKKLSAGEIYAVEGDDVTAFANVVSGVAKLVRGMEDGREQIVGLLFASDFLGRTFGGDTTPKVPYTVEAATDMELCTFAAKGFEAAVSRHPMLERKLLERTLGELDAARDWMLLLGRKTAGERVATFLLHIARRCASTGCEPARLASSGFELPLSRSDMADYIGLTIETVSRQISKLRKDNVITMDGTRHVVSVDLDRLAERAGL